jgi:hypothetical protein
MKQRVKGEAQHNNDMDGRTVSRCWRKERRHTVHILYYTSNERIEPSQEENE